MKIITVNPTIIHKAVAVVRQMSTDEQLLRAIQKREETLMNEHSALNSARRHGKEEGLEEGIEQGREQGAKQKEEELIAKWRKKGYTDKQIQGLLS